MINYIEKGLGLHEAIRNAGHQLRQENGEWLASDEKAVQRIIDEYDPLPVEIGRVKARINSYAAAMRNKITNGISPAEMASWPVKIAEAQRYAEGGVKDDAPMLAREAIARGVSIENVVSRVIENGTALSSLESDIAGIAGKHRDAVSASKDYLEALAYDFSDGWPDV